MRCVGKTCKKRWHSFTILKEIFSHADSIIWNNSSVWLESKCPGTEQNRRRTSHSKRELSFSEVVVEVSCQKPSVARFWQAVTKTKEKESYLEECEKFAWDFGLFQDIYFLAIQITFFLILEILQKSWRSEFQTGQIIIKYSKKLTYFKYALGQYSI